MSPHISVTNATNSKVGAIEMHTDHLIASTFETHQPLISRYALASPEGLADTYRFTLATIQQPLFHVPEIVADFRDKGASSKWAWGFKGDCLNWLEASTSALYRHTVNLWEAYPNPDHLEGEALAYFATLPGLGLVKGGFFAQLVYGVGGCLDSHNVARFGLNPQAFKASSFKAAKRQSTRNSRIALYRDLLSECGGAALLWAEWCAYVATRGTHNYQSAEHVSRLHCEALSIAS